MGNFVYEQMFQKKNADLDRRSYLYDIVELVNNLKYLKTPNSFKDAVVSGNVTYIQELDNISEKVDDLKFDFGISNLYDKKIPPSAISVVTNGLNSNKMIKRIRDFTECPILVRDFVISPIQIFEAKEAGASALTLIPSIISYKSLKEFIELANGMELGCVPEISDSDDILPLVDAGVEYLIITPDLSDGMEGLNKLLSSIPSHIVKIVHFPNFDASMANIINDYAIDSVII